MKKWRIIGFVCLLLLVFGLGAWSGVWIDRYSPQVVTLFKGGASGLQLVGQAWNITRDNYVDKTATQAERLSYGTIDGMVNSLGDTGHSVFLTPDELRQQNDYEQGQLEGIGIEVQEKDGNVVVLAPIQGSPAQKAGLRSGDIILKVDGQPVKDITDAVQRILGPAGTSVTLTIQASSGVTEDVTLTRAKISVASVSWRQLPGTTIVHLRLSSFAKGTASELDSALSAIEGQGATGIILDLRDNPGGLLEEAVAVASSFIKSGNVLLEKDASGKITPVSITSGAAVTDLPVVVLVNEFTASAAEIVAGALRDSGRAKLVGETTFGTGTVLEQFLLSDGSAVVLATQEWLTPSGKTIWHTGLAPDETVSLASNIPTLVPDLEEGLTADQLKTSGDQQLLEALNLLE